MATNTSTVNKQNKLLLIALVVILASAALLVAVTGSANRKNDENPPLDGNTEITDGTKNGNGSSKAEESKEGVKLNGDGEKSDGLLTPGEKKEEKSGSDSDKTNDKTEKDKKDEKTDAVQNEAVDVSAVPEDKLPEFTSPVDSVVLKGASLVTPVFSYTMNDYRTHGGLDFACSPGTPVCAAADGCVSEVSDDPMMGVTVAVTHSGGAVTKYKGLAEETLSMHAVGDEVKQGDVIGVSGDTALIESAEENHVHFELSVNGEIKDPSEYMSVVFLKDLVED